MPPPIRAPAFRRFKSTCSTTSATSPRNIFPPPPSFSFLALSFSSMTMPTTAMYTDSFPLPTSMSQLLADFRLFLSPTSIVGTPIFFLLRTFLLHRPFSLPLAPDFIHYRAQPPSCLTFLFSPSPRLQEPAFGLRRSCFTPWLFFPFLL